jgi:hypothetical protein
MEDEKLNDGKNSGRDSNPENKRREWDSNPRGPEGPQAF